MSNENNSLADSDGGKSDSEKCAVMRQPPADAVQPMQFEVNQNCPYNPPGKLPPLPRVIWVDLGDKPRPPFETTCPGKKYRVPRVEANLIRIAGKLPLIDRDCHVCEHMGHLIE